MAASYPSGQGGVAVRRRRTQAGRGRGCEAASYPSGQGGVAVRGGDGGLVGEVGGGGRCDSCSCLDLVDSRVCFSK